MVAESLTTDATFVIFNVAGTSYCVRSDQVQHVELLQQVTRVPNAAPFVDGVVFSRGQVVPALNLRARFGFDRAPYDVRTRLIVVQRGDRTVGLIVDESREILRLASATILPPPEILTGLGRYVAGVVSVNGRLILVLDLEQLLNVAEPWIAA